MPGVDLNYFIRQANKLTEKIEKRKKELAEETVEGKAGDGLVTVKVNGVAGAQERSRSTPRPSTPTTSRCSRTWSSPPSTPRSPRAATTCSRSWRRSPAASRSPGMT